MVYVGMDGEVITNHLQPKDTLDVMRHLARGKAVPDNVLCKQFNKATNNGKNMSKVSQLLEDAIMSIIEQRMKETLTVSLEAVRPHSCPVAFQDWMILN